MVHVPQYLYKIPPTLFSGTKDFRKGIEILKYQLSHTYEQSYNSAHLRKKKYILLEEKQGWSQKQYFQNNIYEDN